MLLKHEAIIPTPCGSGVAAGVLQERAVITAILVGGKGTRLFGDQTAVPKALYEIGNRPILWHIMKLYASHGFRDFLLLLGYKGEQIVDYVLRRAPYEDHDLRIEIPVGGRPEIIEQAQDDDMWRITMCHTGLDSEKGERIRQVRRYLEPYEHFMVTYGDGLADLDLEDLARFHLEHGRIATLTAVRTRSQFGHVRLNADGRITEMVENPMLPEWVNGGFMVFSQAIFDWLEPDDTLEAGALRRLAEAGEMMAYQHEGFWACMDTYKDNLRLNELWNSDRAAWKKW